MSKPTGKLLMAYRTIADLELQVEGLRALLSKPTAEAEGLVMIRCQACQKSSYSAQWVGNQGKCPRCGNYSPPTLRSNAGDV